MKTIVYIDGYNLYFSLLKGTVYKWLDLHKLFSGPILLEQNPEAEVTRIKFFTADTKAKFATHSQDANKSQEHYHRALTERYSQLDIIKGYYSMEGRPLIRYKQPPDKTDRVKVWTLEEKQTDVNMALHIYRDVVVMKACELAVIVSNDTDLEPALQMIRTDVGDSVQIGVILPVRPPQPDKKQRPPNARLSKLADWTRHHIADAELATAQLPDVVPTRRKAIRKPNYW